MSDYRHDVFLSYSRAPASRRWVTDFFLPLLDERLHEELGGKPRIFLDQRDIPTGSKWPKELEEALHGARCLVAVLSKPYFDSAWCNTEWNTMEAREKGATTRLIYPLRFSDGDDFPQAVKERQTLDMRRFGVTSPAFPSTPLHVEFELQVQRIAEELAALIRQAPPWQPSWQPVRGKAIEPPFPQPRLR